MALINWLKKRFGLEGMTGAKLLSYSGFALFLWFMFGVFERLRDFLLDILIPLAPPALQSIGKAILTVLFYPINANVLTILVGILVFIPVYHYALRRLYKSKPGGQIIFLDNFNATSRFSWSAPYWGGDATTVQRTKGFFVFQAKPGEWTKVTPGENGALIDITNSVVEGYSYKVSCMAKADENTTMQFRLWVHDIQGQASVITPFDTPGSTLTEYSVKFVATKTNGMRIHLHCKEGSGRILVTDVTVTLIKP